LKAHCQRLREGRDINVKKKISTSNDYKWKGGNINVKKKLSISNDYKWKQEPYRTPIAIGNKRKRSKRNTKETEDAFFSEKKGHF